jgi:hypothetical protein
MRQANEAKRDPTPEQDVRDRFSSGTLCIRAVLAVVAILTLLLIVMVVILARHQLRM